MASAREGLAAAFPLKHGGNKNHLARVRYMLVEPLPCFSRNRGNRLGIRSSESKPYNNYFSLAECDISVNFPFGGRSQTRSCCRCCACQLLVAASPMST